MVNTYKIIKSGNKKKLVFISHGRSYEWYKLKDFLVEELNVEYEEFNREPVAGIHTSERLKSMLETSSLALIIMTAEDQMSDGTARTRENVVHELGLFQGKLGFNKAIIIMEEDCNEFTNIAGLNHIEFPSKKIEYSFDKVRRVLRREGVI